MAFLPHAVIANSSQLARQERSCGRHCRRAESDPFRTSTGASRPVL